eukprot:CAMPEP_0179359800 /NCGR_PEP_ID=MMETSP0797-20121207/79637_1 /TAXON_ID=47934 /ORGANISM="Dinophysis acuminata, Strain DAEP01" /LENGTH=196 /DNA_ID=CAMNT_0021075113 /DNA_START=8 /DNA_END=596 /DNA_ORIENTATION=+
MAQPVRRARGPRARRARGGPHPGPVRPALSRGAGGSRAHDPEVLNGYLLELHGLRLRLEPLFDSDRLRLSLAISGCHRCDELLAEEDVVLVELLHLAVQDLLHDLLVDRAPRLLGAHLMYVCSAVSFSLFFYDVGGYVRDAHKLRLRGGPGHTCQAAPPDGHKGCHSPRARCGGVRVLRVGVACDDPVRRGGQAVH